MAQGIYEVASRALAQEKKLAVLANNISNINTVGFKEQILTFMVDDPTKFSAISNKDALITKQSNVFPSPLSLSTFTDFSSGQMKQTGNQLDFCLAGKGFFCVDTPQGTKYTRQGNFILDNDGYLVTQKGLPVLGDNGRIRINNPDFTVDNEGNISVEENIIDALKIVDFPEPYSMRRTGSSLFSSTDTGYIENKADPIDLRQGYVELSNVKATEMMVEMINAFRAYESYQKVIQSMDDASSKLINEVGRLG